MPCDGAREFCKPEDIGVYERTLLKVRKKRIPPGLDDKCLTAWNAMLVTGLLDAYKATQNKRYKVLAIDCLNALIEK